MKEQMILNQKSAISTTLERFFARVHECDHKVIDFCRIFHTQLTLSKEGIKQQDDLKALHKLIDFLVVHQCQFVQDFFPCLRQQGKCRAQDDAWIIGPIFLGGIQNFRCETQPWKTAV